MAGGGGGGGDGRVIGGRGYVSGRPYDSVQGPGFGPIYCTGLCLRAKSDNYK